MKNCLFLLFAFLLSSCNGEIDVFIGKKKTQSTVGINSIVFSEDDVAQFEVISSAYSTLLIQNCQYQYIGMGLNETHSCSHLNNYAYDSITNQISWDTDYLENGEYRFSIDLLVDGASRTSEKTIILNRKNRNPALTNATLVSTNENEDFFLTLTATDPDVGTYDDALTFSCLSCPLGMSIVSGNLISYPAANVTTNFSFSVRVQDQYGGSSDLTISVDVNPINHAPVLASVADITFIENQTPAGELQLAASDVDGNTLTYSYICTPLCVDSSINSSTGLFTWTPILGAAGNYNIEFIVSDGSLTHSRTIVATVRSGNTAPIVANINDQILRTLDFNPDAIATTIAFSATDADGDALSYSCFILNVTNDNVAEVSSSSMECEDSTFVTFDAVARTITLAANDVDRGFYRILLRASDSFTHTDEIFSVSVNRAIYRFALKMDAGYLDSLLPFVAKANNRYIVDWGDNTTTTSITNFPTHTYQLSALGSSAECATCVEVRVGGQLEQMFYWTNNPSYTAMISTTPFLEAKKQINRVYTLGDLNWGNLDYAFNEAEVVNFNSGYVSNSFNSAKMMFGDAIELQYANLDNFDASNVLTVDGLRYMFKETTKLKDVDLNGMNINGVKNLTCMFCDSGVENVDLSGMDFSTVQTMRWMFDSTPNIIRIDFTGATFNNIAAYDDYYYSSGGYNINDGERFREMFYNSYGGEVDFSNATFDVDHFHWMFYYSRLSRIKFNNAKIKVEGIQTAHSGGYSAFKDGDYMFHSVVADLVDFSGAEFENFQNLNHAFYYASIEQIKFNDANIVASSSAELFHLFEQATVTLIDFSGATFDGPIITESMFNNMWVQYIDFSNTAFVNGVDLSRMFNAANRADMISFKGADLNGLALSTSNIFEGLPSNDLDMSDIIFDTRLDIYNTFGNFEYTMNLSFKGAQLLSGANISETFSYAYNMRKLDLSGMVNNPIAADFDYIFREFATSGGTAHVNLSQYNNISSQYDTLIIPPASTWVNYDLDMSSFVNFYCDYDAGVGFGSFNTKSCTDPSSFVEIVFPAKPTF